METLIADIDILKPQETQPGISFVSLIICNYKLEASCNVIIRFRLPMLDASMMFSMQASDASKPAIFQTFCIIMVNCSTQFKSAENNNTWDTCLCLI